MPHAPKRRKCTASKIEIADYPTKILSSSSPFYTVTLLHRSTRLHCLAMSVALPCNVLPFSFGYRRFFCSPFSLSTRTLLLVASWTVRNTPSVTERINVRRIRFYRRLPAQQQGWLFTFLWPTKFFSSGFLCIAKFFPTVLVQVLSPGFLFHSWYCSRSWFVSLRRGRMCYPHDS